jgi:hypothetical protein
MVGMRVHGEKRLEGVSQLQSGRLKQIEQQSQIRILTMVSPGGVGHVDGGSLSKEARVELESETATTSSGENLGNSELRERTCQIFGALEIYVVYCTKRMEFPKDFECTL